MMYSENLRQKVISARQEGVRSTLICEQYGISRSTLYKWVKEGTPDANGEVPRERYLLEKELKRLRMEVDIYRTCGCSPSSPLEERLEAIDWHKDKFSIHAMCRVLQVRRSTYLYHANRAPEKTLVEQEDDILKPLVAEIFEKSRRRFGCRRIRAKLMEMGYVVSERRVRRLMKEQGLYVQTKTLRKNSANDRKYKYYPNKLQRNFLTDAPNKVWVSDITYARVGERFLYLCVIIDLYARKVVGYEISDEMDTHLVACTFRKAYRERGRPEGLLFHSDQGCQYTSYAFRKLLRERGVEQSFSAPGSPYDNAVAESFFAAIKQEDLRRNFYGTEEEFCVAVEEYINFYNDYRPHSKLNYMTPNQGENAYFEQ